MGRKTMTEIKIPDYWTPEQALAVVEFIDEIREAIFSQYQLQIIEQMRSERCTEIEVTEIIERREIPF
jgi:hypothetical protein